MSHQLLTRTTEWLQPWPPSAALKSATVHIGYKAIGYMAKSVIGQIFCAIFGPINGTKIFVNLIIKIIVQGQE